MSKVLKRTLCVLERKYPVDHRLNLLGVQKFADFGELGTVGLHEKKRVFDIAPLCQAHDLAAHQAEHEGQEDVQAFGPGEAASSGPMSETIWLPGLRMDMDFSIASPLTVPSTAS